MIEAQYSITCIFQILLGSLWIWWLASLGASDSADPTLRCRDVKPYVRTFLFLMSWIFLTVSLLVIVLIVVQRQPITIAVLVAVYALIHVIQILYIRQIQASKTRVVDDCTQHARTKRMFLYVCAGVLVASGVIQMVRVLRRTKK